MRCYMSAGACGHAGLTPQVKRATAGPAHNASIGKSWRRKSKAGLPMIQYITGPVYLLNFGILKVTTELTD